jgi:hypothetical protein
MISLTDQLGNENAVLTAKATAPHVEGIHTRLTLRDSASSVLKAPAHSLYS